MSARRPRIGTIPYVAQNPSRVSVFNSDYDEFGCRIARDVNPWRVEINGRLLGDYRTHPEAIERAATVK